MKRSLASLAIGAVAVVMMVSPEAAKAGELKFWMDAFKPDQLPLQGTSASLVSYQNPSGTSLFSLGGDKDAWVGWVPVKLPVGTTIKSVVYYHGSSSGSYTICQLRRVKFGKADLLLAGGASDAAAATTVTLSAIDADKATIASGYRYYINISVPVGTSVRGVKITY